MKTDAIRDKFLEFFKAKKHRIVPGDSLVPAGDPSVLFTSAGMNQFKEQFMGHVGSFRRAASCQKCLRTGDLDNVGKTPFHHTFFEMLGNFSFGDYFKKEAIEWGWEFMTEWMELNQKDLWVSVYKEDDEAYKIWKEVIGVPDKKIVKLDAHSNFWPANAPEDGPNGPCGPCSEIFFDKGKNAGCKKKDCSPACDCGRFVEVWNLVFTQFNRKAKNDLEPLPSRNIDTGMGLERMAAVMQGVDTNFGIDIFKPVVEMIEKEVEKNATKSPRMQKELINAIADHVRAVTFAIAEGILPSNEERGYVIRKLIRRSIWYSAKMNVNKPYLYKIVSPVVRAMKAAYPDLEDRREEVAQVVKYEEEKFWETLESGRKIAEASLQVSKGKKIIKAEDAFKLYDTYGFPLELTLEIAQAKGAEVDVKGFDKLMEKQRKLSQKSSIMEADIFAGAKLDEELKKIKQEQKFVGYEKSKVKTKVLLFKKVKGIFEIILKESPFYGESGGQVGDSGVIFDKNSNFEAFDTKNLNGVIVCLAKLKKGSQLSGEVTAEVDEERRDAIMCNHTATHLLQAALREVLGKHIKQSGSLVDGKHLRFDFTHFKSISPADLKKVENLVNENIKKNISLCSGFMSLAEAKKKGALAFFGEKYGEKVRMVSVGDVSKELCGGTHLESTGKIGLFRILNESSIASGIRRIEAVTGKEAQRLVKEEKEGLDSLCKDFNTTQDKLSQKVDGLLQEFKKLEKKIRSLGSSPAKINVEELEKEAEDINGIKLLVKDFGSIDRKLQHSFSDMLKNRAVASVTFTLATMPEGTLSSTCTLSKEAVEKGLDASNILKQILSEFGGSGGGRKDFAQGGIRESIDVNKVLNKAKEILKGELR